MEGGSSNSYETDPSKYLLLCNFNQSDSTAIQKCSSGQNITEVADDWAVTKGKLNGSSSAGSAKLAIDLMETGDAPIQNFTCDTYFSTDVSVDRSGFGAETFSLTKGGGSEATTVRHRDGGEGTQVWYRDSASLFIEVSPRTNLSLEQFYVLRQTYITNASSNYTIYTLVNNSGTLEYLPNGTGNFQRWENSVTSVKSLQFFGFTTSARVIVDEVACWNWTAKSDAYTRLTSAPILDTTLPIVNSSLNSSIIKINDILNITGNATDETGLQHINLTVNLSTGRIFQNISLGAGVTSFYFKNLSFQIPVGRNHTLNISIITTDTSGNRATNSTIININNTAPYSPTILFPILNNLSNFQPLDLNLTWQEDADSDSVTQVKWYINNTLNQTIIIGQNTGNTTLNASDGKYNISVSIFDGEEYSQNTTLLSFKIDIVNPTDDLLTVIPTRTFISQDTNFTITATDQNLEAHNVTCFRNGTDIINFSQEALNIAQTINQIKIQANISWGEDLYYCFSNESDDHTALSIPDYVVSQNSSSLRFDTPDGVSIKIHSKLLSFVWLFQERLISLKTQKRTDRYIFNLTFLEGITLPFNITLPVEIESNSILRYRKTSQYSGHFVTKENWIDFGKGYSTTVTKIKDNNYKVDIKTNKLSWVFESIGGVNKGGSMTEIEIDTGLPQFISLNISENGLKVNNSFVRNNITNFTINVSDKNPHSVLAYINNIKNATATYTANSTFNLTINITKDGNYTILLEINDSAGNKFNSTVYGFALDTKIPIFENATNKTRTGSKTITTDTDVNISVYLADSYLLNGNFSHNASGSWSNQSISSIGNSTYEYIIGKGNFTGNKVVGWKFYVHDIAGNVLDPIYTFKVGEIPTYPPSGGDGGSASVGQVLNQDAQPALANGYTSCSEGNQYFDGACYPCSDGALARRTDGSVVCVKCNQGFESDGVGGCKLKKSNTQFGNSLLENIDFWSAKISPENPLIGFVIVIFLLIISGYYLLEGKFKIL